MSISSNLSNVGNALASTTNVINNLDWIQSNKRLDGIPNGAELVGDLFTSVATFKDGNSNDWRVRLSLPPWVSFRTSPALKPLIDAGGLIFPYTPRISLESNAKYTPVSPIHSNYTFQAYMNSDPGKITITAPMNAEDQSQALYWIGVLHLLRSLTKMFSGNDPKAGNPPPIVYLNGYGGYVFKNVPVVVTSFTTELANDCDYIPVNVSGSLGGAVSSITSGISGLAGSIGQTISGSGASTFASSISNIAGGVGAASDLAATFGIGGTVSGGTAYVPTKSSFTVNLQPVYSRNSARNFSLDKFVTGGYLNNYFGYI